MKPKVNFTNSNIVPASGGFSALMCISRCWKKSWSSRDVNGTSIPTVPDSVVNTCKHRAKGQFRVAISLGNIKKTSYRDTLKIY